MSIWMRFLQVLSEMFPFIKIPCGKHMTNMDTKPKEHEGKDK